MRDWVNGVTWHQLRNATLWIQLLCHLATLQPVLLGDHSGATVLTGDTPLWPPLRTATVYSCTHMATVGVKGLRQTLIADNWLARVLRVEVECFFHSEIVALSCTLFVECWTFVKIRLHNCFRLRTSFLGSTICVQISTLVRVLLSFVWC